jgi:hypothetical protein
LARWISDGIIRNWLGRHRPLGAVVPFETPALHMARVCEDERDGLIAILRNFANNGAAYIVPWTSLPLMVPMTVHDTALHTGIGERKATTPAAVRAVISELALSGALGPEAKASEVERSRAGRTRLADVELVLILLLLSSCDANLATLIADKARWAALDAKAAVATAAAVVGLRRRDIYTRTNEFARLLAPVGLLANEGPAQPGWLRVLQAEIEAFGRSCTTCPRPGSPDIDASLAVIGRSATRTAQLANTVLSIIDYAVLDICETIRRWSAEQSVLRQVIDQLSSMLDEWPALMKAVHDALREPQADVVSRLQALKAMLPQVPEIDASADNDGSEARAGSLSISSALATKLCAIGSMLNCSPLGPKSSRTMAHCIEP